MKVKLFALVPRRPDVTKEAFHDHWRHPHGTLAKRISVLRGYVQSHRIECALFDEKQRRYDGIAEAWLDSEADAAYFGEDPVYVRDLKPDEPKFGDQANLKFLITTEDVIMARPDARNGADLADSLWAPQEQSVSIKVIQIVEAVGPQGWRSAEDLDLGKRIGAFRHVCCEPSVAVHGNAPPLLGIRELWWPTLTAFNTGRSADEKAWRALIGRPTSAITVLAQAERVM